MYNLDVEEFKGSKSATEVEWEGIKSGEEEMEAGPSRALTDQDSSKTSAAAHLRGNVSTLQERDWKPQLSPSHNNQFTD